MTQIVYLYQRDLRAVDSLDHLTVNGFDAVFCDAPYGLAAGKSRTWDDLEAGKGRGFMGKSWDAAVPGVTFWARVLQVLAPGAPLLTFAGTRTLPRMACAIEDAGFELRDMLVWINAQGFPKGLDVSAAMDKPWADRGEVVSRGRSGGAGSTIGPDGLARGAYEKRAPVSPLAKHWAGYDIALKPALEPACLARKPLGGGVLQNAIDWGCGPLNIDGCRLPTADKLTAPPVRRHGNTVLGKGLGFGRQDEPPGRWPTGVLLDEVAAAELDAQSGTLTSGKMKAGTARKAGNSSVYGAASDVATSRDIEGDSGGASRFFYQAKVSRAEREAGCEHLPARSGAESVGRTEGSAGLDNPRAGAGRRAREVRNGHPTLKPLALTEYLARLLLPPPHTDNRPRRIFVPFSGTGSEVIGCLRAGWDEVVAIEFTAEYLPIFHARLAHHCPDAAVLAEPAPQLSEAA